MKKKIQYAFIDFVRWIGKQVCRVKGEHDFFYPGGCCDTSFAYSCIRCGEFDRPLESLPQLSDDEQMDRDFGVDCMDRQKIEEEHEHARRWISWLKYPKWI